MLIEGSIKTKDIPAYWNEHYQKYLGIKVPDDKQGCLQDVHWSHGSFGYFATYSLGSLYAAQLYAAFSRQNPSFEKELALGDSGNLLQWLRQQIHRHGRYYTSGELCSRATGETLNSSHFLKYVAKKYNDIYSA
jgi:carboxypeptidase Taq